MDLNEKSIGTSKTTETPWPSPDLRMAEIIGSSPQDPAMVRVKHAEATVQAKSTPEQFFNAFSRWAGYEYWAPEFQGAGHWLVVRERGPGSRFILYDKPGVRHLTHFGVVTELDRDRRFAWRAPFNEWKRAYIGTILELTPTTQGGTHVTETLYFDAREDHLPIVAGFMAVPGFDGKTMSTFLEARLRGLDRLIQDGDLNGEALSYLFTRNKAMAADWPDRISTGEWVRLLHADGELDFPAPPEVVFNVFSRFARYADWTRTIHVGREWFVLRQGGVGSRFLIWEKPGDRHVMHYGTVVECERNKLFTWRAPFAEWEKVFVGTSLKLSARQDGGTHGYHILYMDVPREYLPAFTGFGTLPGIDIEYETWHIQEEARGLSRLLRSGAFSGEDQQYLFDNDRVLAQDWPTEKGAPYPYPPQVLTHQPNTVLTYEEAAVVATEMIAEMIPNPRFFQKWRDQKRTRQLNAHRAGR